MEESYEQREARRRQEYEEAERKRVIKIIKMVGLGLLGFIALICLKGEAEAKAIRAKASALRDNPLIVKLTEACTQDGVLPSAILGTGMMPIMDMRK